MSEHVHAQQYRNVTDWIGRVPTDWKILRLKHACEHITDGSHFSPESLDEGLPYVTVRDLKEGKVDVENAAKISPDDFQLLAKNGCKPKIGDILFSKDGTIGKIARVESDNFVILSSLAILRPKINIDSRYLSYFLESQLSLDQMKSYLAGAALRRITLDVINDFIVVIPPQSVQNKITAVLDREASRIEHLIAKKERQIELLQEKRTALISRAVTKGLNHRVKMKDSGIEWLGEIPEHWEVKRLKYLTDGSLVNGIFKKKENFGTGYKLVNVFDIYRDNFLVDYNSLDRVEADEDEVIKFGVQPGDIFFVRSSLKLEGIGHSACTLELTEPTVFECHLVRARPKQESITPKYLVNFLNSAHATHRFIALANMVTMATIDQNKIKSLEIPLPPLAEQNIITEYLDSQTIKIDNIAKKIRDGIDKLQEYRTSLISAAVTGKIDVREEVA